MDPKIFPSFLVLLYTEKKSVSEAAFEFLCGYLFWVFFFYNLKRMNYC